MCRRKMTGSNHNLFSDLVVVLSKSLGLFYNKNGGKLKTAYSVSLLFMSFAHVVYVLLCVFVPHLVTSYKEGGKLSLGMYSFRIVTAFTAIINGCIRLSYLSNSEEHLSSIQNYLNCFDSLICQPKRVQRKLTIFKMTTDAALTILIIIQATLIYNHFLFYDKPRVLSFTVHIIEDLSIIVTDIHILQTSFHLFVRLKTINIKLKNILTVHDELIVLSLKREFQKRAPGKRSQEVRQNTFKKATDKGSVECPDNSDETFCCISEEDLKVSKSITDLHGGYFYVCKAFSSFRAFYHLHAFLVIFGSFVMTMFSYIMFQCGDPKEFGSRFIHVEMSNFLTCILPVYVIVNLVHQLEPQVKKITGVLESYNGLVSGVLGRGLLLPLRADVSFNRTNQS